MKRVALLGILALLASCLLNACSRQITSGRVVRKGVDFQGHYVDIKQWAGHGPNVRQRRVYMPGAAAESLHVGDWYQQP